MEVTFHKSVTDPSRYYFEIDMGHLFAGAYMTKKEAMNLAKQLKKAGF